jgi:hypothetical protein
VYSLFPNATPDNENEEQISLVETLVYDDDIIEAYGNIKIKYKHNFNFCYRNMEKE